MRLNQSAEIKAKTSEDHETMDHLALYKGDGESHEDLPASNMSPVAFGVA